MASNNNSDAVRGLIFGSIMLVLGVFSFIGGYTSGFAGLYLVGALLVLIGVFKLMRPVPRD